MSEIIGLNTRLYGNNLLIKEPSLQETEEEEKEAVIVPEQSFTSDEIKYSIITQKFIKEQYASRISADVLRISEQATINVVFDGETYEEVPITVDGGYAIFGDIDLTTYPFYVTGQTKDDYMLIGCAQGVHTIDAYCDGDIQPYPTASLENCEALEEFDGDLLVLFDDVKYRAPKKELSEQIYWGASYIGEDEGFDWDECPFVILYRDGGEIYTETEGRHTIIATVYVPIQRVDMPIVSEHYMKDYVEGHGGSSNPLPEVTSDDNGDVLTVVEGEWAKAQPSSDSGLVIATFVSSLPPEYDITCDKTYSELRTALENGIPVFANIDGAWSFMRITSPDGISAYWLGTYDEYAPATVACYLNMESDTITMGEKTIDFSGEQ